MSRRAKLLICAALLAVAGGGGAVAIAVDQPSPAGASPSPEHEISSPAMVPVASEPGAQTLRARGGGRKKHRGRGKPRIKDLITTDPVTVEAGGTRVVSLSCGRSQGIALDGGVISPPPPAQVVVITVSRANPNPPFANSRRNYYVGVRNLDPDSAATFRGTLVCARGIQIR